MGKTTIESYNGQQIKLAFDLMNTFDPLFEYPERMADLEDLHRFVLDCGFPGESQLNDADLVATRRLSSALRGVVEADHDETVSKRLNELLEGAPVRASLVADDGGGWRIGLAAGDGLDPVSWLTTEAALGLALALQSHGRDRLRSCAADPCREVFIDLSRNRSRRYCSDRCANRHNVAAFRQRQRSGNQD